MDEKIYKQFKHQLVTAVNDSDFKLVENKYLS